MAMHEIICPHCGKAFKIDDAGFEKQLHERLELAEQDKRNAVEIAEQRAAGESQKAA